MAWSLPAAETAQEKHEFIMVTKGYTPRVNMTDAHRIWMDNNSVVFQTGYRIAGTAEDITDALLAANVAQEDIVDLLNTSITVDNYSNEMKSVYNEEIALYNAWMRSVLKSNADAPGAKLFDVMAAVNPDLLHRVKSTQEGKTLGVTTGKARGRRMQSLIDKIAKLAPNKVLDVSRLKPDGTGTRSIDPPVTARKLGSPNLPIVSSDFEHYLMAINMLPGGQERYAADVEYVRQLFTQTPAKTTAKARPAILGVGTIPTFPITSVPTPTTVFNPVLQGRAVPQTEQIVPVPVRPTFTKSQREKIKKREEVVRQAQPPMPPPQQPAQFAQITELFDEFDEEDEFDDNNEYDDEFSEEDVITLLQPRQAPTIQVPRPVPTPLRAPFPVPPPQSIPTAPRPVTTPTVPRPPTTPTAPRPVTTPLRAPFFVPPPQSTPPVQISRPVTTPTVPRPAMRIPTVFRPAQ